MSNDASKDMLLREIHVVDNLQSLSSQNWRYPPNYSKSTIDPFPVTRGRTLHHRQDEKAIMRYVKIRTHHDVASKHDDLNDKWLRSKQILSKLGIGAIDNIQSSDAKCC
ncbi:hypothetical protein H5410_061522 [Solanum commersonii]|uniref:Uncharacterized protein n=1 Tax=Solanum commersonii TaxID=4109 RepID=A0A9J5W945_SOLCO|nr:hypothetical protein H5410_061522 [Solanum commersonii]